MSLKNSVCLNITITTTAAMLLPVPQSFTCLTYLQLVSIVTLFSYAWETGSGF